MGYQGVSGRDRAQRKLQLTCTAYTHSLHLLLKSTAHIYSSQLQLTSTSTTTATVNTVLSFAQVVTCGWHIKTRIEFPELACRHARE